MVKNFAIERVKQDGRELKSAPSVSQSSSTAVGKFIKYTENQLYYPQFARAISVLKVRVYIVSRFGNHALLWHIYYIHTRVTKRCIQRVSSRNVNPTLLPLCSNGAHRVAV